MEAEAILPGAPVWVGVRRPDRRRVVPHPAAVPGGGVRAAGRPARRAARAAGSRLRDRHHRAAAGRHASSGSTRWTSRRRCSTRRGGCRTATIRACAGCLARAEDAPLDPPYALVTAAASLHWMDWAVVLPRLHDALMPNGLLVIIVDRQRCQRRGAPSCSPILARYSTNQEYQIGFDLMTPSWSAACSSWTSGGARAPVPFRQPIEAYVESFHARSGFSRARMTPAAIAEFDEAVRCDRLPVRRDGRRSRSLAHVAWGRPLPRSQQAEAGVRRRKQQGQTQLARVDGRLQLLRRASLCSVTTPPTDFCRLVVVVAVVAAPAIDDVDLVGVEDAVVAVLTLHLHVVAVADAADRGADRCRGGPRRCRRPSRPAPGAG